MQCACKQWVYEFLNVRLLLAGTTMAREHPGALRPLFLRARRAWSRRAHPLQPWHGSPAFLIAV
jgi:hypothetical protein